VDLISRKAAIDRLNAIPPGNWSKARYTRELWNVPSVPAVPLDKLCELYEEAGARVPCVICSKIMPEWCKENNNLPLSWDEEYKCPSWKAILTKWMEEQDADRQ
jgi:hypothetical protein